MEGGFRLYSDTDVHRLERIVELKRLLGVPLSLIKEIVEAEELLQQLRAERRSTDDLVAKRASLEKAMGIIEAQVGFVHERMSAMQQLQDRYRRPPQADPRPARPPRYASRRAVGAGQRC